ncbi:MAG: creatininase family protein [Planctomycetota bacterium]|nr:creatininase family protein [Planctomycetota bacterium]
MKAPLWQYEKLTWPEINTAVAAKKVVVVPVGSIEQHGPHLPLDVDVVCPTGIARMAAELVPDQCLIMPTQIHGYTGHVMDFPGTINVHYTHFIDLMIDIGKSLAYHGFKRIIYLNGHGSNMPNLDLVSRRVNIETDAVSSYCAWWSMLNIDKDFMPKWRESYFPGGCAHACELETSVYLYFDEENVRKDKVADGRIAFHKEKSDFQWVDLFGAGPGVSTSYTASYTDTGVLGAADLATKSKGERAAKEAARQLARLIVEFRNRPKPPRGDHHAQKPTMPMPWGQEDEKPDRMGDVHGG